MNIKLSERMEALATLITPGSRLADVGCDHAFLPIELCRTGRIPSAIAMDVKPGPLARAAQHIAACGLDDRIAVRRSDGLEALGDGEADAVLIAGMGGLLITRILTERPIPESVAELILAPQSEAADVRRCVREIGFVITDEDMVLEDEKYYPMLKAARRMDDAAQADREEACDTESAQADREEARDTESVQADTEESDHAGSVHTEGMRQEMEDAFGPVLLVRRHPVLYKWLARERTVTDEILAHLREEMLRLPGHANLKQREAELEHWRRLLEAAWQAYQ